MLRVDSTELSKLGPVVETVALFLKDNSVVLVALPIIAFTAKHFAEVLETQWIKQAVQQTLTHYCNNMFSHLEGGPDEHRATLFKRKNFALLRTFPWKIGRHPWSGWLVPIARSGHTTQEVRSRFLAPDKAPKAEGIAGATWRNAGTLTVEGLPLLGKSSDDEAIKAYSEKTKTPVKWIKERLESDEGLPRALKGFPVEVDNQIWGVVVLDSSHPQPFEPDGQDALTTMTTFSITKLLERAKL